MPEFGNNRVSTFTPDGTFVSAFGSTGGGPGEFNEANGVAVDADGLIFVADFKNGRVQVFDPSVGAFLYQFGHRGKGDGQFSDLSTVVVDDEGNLYAVDSTNGRIQKFRLPDDIPLATPVA